jgi:hypothetical protein
MDYSWKPIIIEGVAHSGTRVLVQILSTLGSQGGDYDNPWKENKFFLDLHKSLISKLSDRGWTQTIYDLQFVREFRDDLKFKDHIQSLVRTELHNHFPSCSTTPWHWKCPTSGLFEKTWVEVFPEAYYIHIVRDPLECTESFLRRNQFKNMREGVEFCSRMDNRITEIPKKNYLKVRYENLSNEIERIQAFVPLEFDQRKIELAKSLIRRDSRYWYKDKTLRQNFLNLRAKLLCFLSSRSLSSQDGT